MRTTFRWLTIATFAAAGCTARPLAIGHEAGAGGATGGGVSGAAGTAGGAGAGTAGEGTGGAGTGGTGTGGAAGGPALPVDITAAFDGQTFMMPCGPNSDWSELSCRNSPRGSYCGTVTTDDLTQGNVMRDDTLTVDGPPGTIYDVTLRVRGVVEPRHYTDGMREAPPDGGSSYTYGWYVGGAPVHGGTYGIYMIWVSSPVVMPNSTRDGQFYFLNAVMRSEAHFAYPIDYTVTFPVAAGAEVRFLADDSNCSMVKNCDDTSVDGFPGAMNAKCNPITVADLPASAGIEQPYRGQFIYLSVVSITTE